MRLVASLLGICILFSTSMAVEIDRSALQLASHCLGDVPVKLKVNAPNYCIVENPIGDGYAVLAHCTDGGMRVVGYSTTGKWDNNSLPPALVQWLEHLGTVGPSVALDTSRERIEPLLTCHWHQNSPYNDLAPVITDGNVKCVAGCVAIAASQITYYWRKDNPRATLEDTPLYPYGGAPVTMSIPAGTPNNWNLLRDEYTDSDSPESRAAAAQLCYVIGTTSYLNYASSTGGHIDQAANAMFCQYQLLSDYYSKSSFSQEQWDNLLYQEVIQRRPVMCSGHGSGGHAFVLDGYDNETGLFHFNFGWGGSGDGYYAIDDSEDAMGGYSQGQAVVCNIRPKYRNVSVHMTAWHDGPSSGKAFICISNSGTLPIARLSLYAAEPLASLENSSPVWQSENVVENDSIVHEITVEQFDLPAGDDINLYLIDEYGSVLATCSLESSGLDVKMIDREAPDAVIYDLNGVKVNDMRQGAVYVISNGTTTRKIIIK